MKTHLCTVPVVPVAVQPTKKPPSRFFKSKSAPVVNNPAPLRPLEVTPNQPLKQPLPPAKGKFYNMVTYLDLS